MRVTSFLAGIRSNKQYLDKFVVMLTDPSCFSYTGVMIISFLSLFPTHSSNSWLFLLNSERVWLFSKEEGLIKTPNLSFLEISDLYVDLVWDQVSDGRGHICPDYQRLARMLSEDPLDGDEASSPSFPDIDADDAAAAAAAALPTVIQSSPIRPVEAKNLSSFGGGGYVRFRRQDLLDSLGLSPRISDPS